MRKHRENTLRQLPEGNAGYGNIRLHLDEIIRERDISLNQLSFRAEMQRGQLRRYRNNTLQRLDIDILTRLCYVLDCSLSDLVEYVPPQTSASQVQEAESERDTRLPQNPQMD